MECNQVFHTSLSVCSNKYLYNINHSVVVMEIERFFLRDGTDYFNLPYYLHGLSLQEAKDFILSKEILIQDQMA